MPRKARDTKRVQFELTDQTIQELDALTDMMGAASRAEALRFAIAIMKVAAERQKEGSRLMLVGRDHSEAVVIPGTTTVQTHMEPAMARSTTRQHPRTVPK